MRSVKQKGGVRERIMDNLIYLVGLVIVVAYNVTFVLGHG